MSDTSKALPEGTILDSGQGKYKIIKMLGQGGFGITYLATGMVKVQNVMAEAMFAIKEHFPDELATRTGTQSMPKEDQDKSYTESKSDFLKEARRLHDLGSRPNIVSVNEVFETNGTAYYVMQYINGVSLKNYVKEKKKLKPEEALEILVPVMKAVDFLHSHRINHLDIKPENIMLNTSMNGTEPVLIDFGLSIRFNKDGSKTSSKQIYGFSDGFSPMEQYGGISEFLPQADVYSLAATLLYMLTGLTPKKASELKVSEVKEALKGTPQHISDAICAALSRSYDDRTPTVKAFLQSLGCDEGEKTSLLNKPGGDDPTPRPDMRKYLMIALAVALVVACAVAAYKLLPGKSESAAPVDPVDTTQVAPVVTPTDTAVTPAEPAKNPADTAANAPHQPAAQPQQQPAAQQHTQPASQQPSTQSQQSKYTRRTEHFNTTEVKYGIEVGPGWRMEGEYENGRLTYGIIYDADGKAVKTIIP